MDPAESGALEAFFEPGGAGTDGFAGGFQEIALAAGKQLLVSAEFSFEQLRADRVVEISYLMDTEPAFGVARLIPAQRKARRQPECRNRLQVLRTMNSGVAAGLVGTSSLLIRT